MVESLPDLGTFGPSGGHCQATRRVHGRGIRRRTHFSFPAASPHRTAHLSGLRNKRGAATELDRLHGVLPVVRVDQFLFVLWAASLAAVLAVEPATIRFVSPSAWRTSDDARPGL